jgi:hypothetical protein
MAKKLTLSDKIDRIAMEATPAELPALLDRFQLAVKFRTQNGTPVKRMRKPKEQPPLTANRELLT